MVKTKFKKAVSLMLAAVMSLTAFMGIGATTAFAAVGEKADVYLVDYPRSGDTNSLNVKYAMSQFASLAHRNFSSILYGRNGKEVIEMSEKRATRVRNKYKYDVPLWHRPILSVAEATEYFGIGSNKIYELTEKENCPFVIWIGSRRVIKRTAFERFLEKQYSI